jgi:hypothetical protein
MLLPFATISFRGDLIYEPATLDLLKKYDLHPQVHPPISHPSGSQKKHSRVKEHFSIG